MNSREGSMLLERQRFTTAKMRGMIASNSRHPDGRAGRTAQSLNCSSYSLMLPRL